MAIELVKNGRWQENYATVGIYRLIMFLITTVIVPAMLTFVYSSYTTLKDISKEETTIASRLVKIEETILAHKELDVTRFANLIASLNESKVEIFNLTQEMKELNGTLVGMKSDLPNVVRKNSRTHKVKHGRR